MAPDDADIFDPEMPSGFTQVWQFLRRNFLYISTLENRGDKSVNQNFQNIVLDTWDSHANFREKLS